MHFGQSIGLWNFVLWITFFLYECPLGQIQWTFLLECTVTSVGLSSFNSLFHSKANLLEKEDSENRLVKDIRQIADEIIEEL